MDQEQKQTLKALQAAVQMEIDGKQFYQQLSKTGSNAAGRQLFAILALEEDRHLQKFQEIYHAIEARAAWPDVRIDAAHPEKAATVFGKMPVGNKGATASELKSVEKALEIENKSIDYYLEQAAAAAYTLEKEYYESIAGQERTHQALLLDYFEFIKDPAQWFTMKEHQSLDGG